MVAAIARCGALPAGSASSEELVVLYTEEELDELLAKFNKSKKCTNGCYTALCASSRTGRRLTLALVILGLFMALTSSLWSLRRFTPIKKTGPWLVRSLECLRSLSISSDIAQAQDELWAKRNAAKLREYCGDCQVGGISDTISLVLALVLLVQLRASQGAATYLTFADLRWAFDFAIHSGMKVNAFLAGIRGGDWLLLHVF